MLAGRGGKETKLDRKSMGSTSVREREGRAEQIRIPLLTAGVMDARWSNRTVHTGPAGSGAPTISASGVETSGPVSLDPPDHL